MEITKLEKAALITTGAAAAYKTLLWSLEANVDLSEVWIIGLRALFAFISFAAFDLVLLAVIARGWSISGMAALIITSGLSGAIGLHVSGVVTWPALHAAPALALAAFGLHLMISRQAAPASVESAPQAITQAVQVNVSQQLPPTVAAYIAARATELPDSTPDELAAALGVGVMSVRKVLQISEQEAAQ